MDIFNLSDYLNNENIESDWKMFGQNNLTIHWSNWDLACNLMKIYFQKNPNSLNFLGFKAKYDQVFNQSLYLKYGDQIFVSKFETFYEEFFNKKEKSWWFNEKFKDVQCQVSIDLLKKEPISFKEMAWFTKEDYSLFVYNKILKGDDVPMRSFRVRTDIHVFAADNEEMKNQFFLNIVQFSEEGVLFKMKNEVYEKLKNENNIFFEFPKYDWNFTKNYKHHQMLNLLSEFDFDSMLKQIVTVDFNGVLPKYNNLSITNEIDYENKYIYVAYSDFKDETKSLEKTFKPMMKAIHAFLLKEMEVILSEEDLKSRENIIKNNDLKKVA